MDRTGKFYNFDDLHARLAQVPLDELEVEFRAQIEVVLEAGLRPTHLDWHALRISGPGGRVEIFDLMFRLAREYGLALRVRGQVVIEKVQNLGFPTVDFDFLDSSSIDPATKAAQYAQLLHDLPPGLSEWAVHPGLDTPELLAMEPLGNHSRQSDYDFFTSPRAKELIEAEGIIQIDYRTLQEVWKKI